MFNAFLQKVLAFFVIVFLLLCVNISFAADLPTHGELTQALNNASADTLNNGGIFTPNQMWAAVVNRGGQVEAVTKTTGTDPWPGSRVIAMQKAYTANAFSNKDLSLSTANLYTAVQPGGSLFGLQFSNPVNPQLAYNGNPEKFGTNLDSAAKNKIVIGGVNVFGGGVPLYDPDTGEVIGAIGVSGDSSCTDHIIAWRIRHALGYTKLPSGVNTGNYGGATAPGSGDDNLILDDTNAFGHPACGFSEETVNDLPSMENF